MTLTILFMVLAVFSIFGSLVIRNHLAAVMAMCWLITELQRYELLIKLGELQ